MKIEASRSGVRREEHPTGWVVTETRDVGAALELGYIARMPGAIDAHLAYEFAHQLEHSHPFGENDDFACGLFQQLAQHAFELFQLGADTARGIENGRRVADHSHAGEILLQAVELFLRERAAFGDSGKPPGQM